MLQTVKRKTIATFGGVASLALLASSGGILASPASAAPSSSVAPLVVKTNLNLAAVGSDTIFCVDNAIFAAYNLKQAGSTGNGNTANNVPPFAGNIGCETAPTTYSVAADSQHGALSFSSTGNACAAPLSGVTMPWLYPAGSSAGITCFQDDQGAGNLAFARSSRGRKGTDPTNMEFWAFALDAVGWTHNTANTHAPASLTPAQMTAIYTCANDIHGVPTTDWSQVGGTAGPITRYFPQAGSGTGSFFATIYLGGVTPVSTMSCPVTFVPENDGTQVASGDLASAVLPYSFGARTAQTNGTETDISNGFVFGKTNGTAPTTASLAEAAAFANISGNACTSPPVPKQFCATRYVYHVTWQTLPASYYSAAIDLIGVPASGLAGANSICKNKYSAKIKLYGFKALAVATTAQSTAPGGGVPGTSNCREF